MFGVKTVVFERFVRFIWTKGQKKVTLIFYSFDEGMAAF